LPDDAVVEIPARVGAGGAQADSLAALAPEMLGLVQQVKAYERLAVRAAVDGDRAAALKALLANPLVGQYKIAKPLLNALLEADLVREVGRSRGERGPSALLYELNPMAGWVVGVDIGRKWVRAAIADIAGTIVARRDEHARVSSAKSLIGQVGAIARRLAT